MSAGIIAATLPEARILCGKALCPGDPICLPGGSHLIVSGMGALRARTASLKLLERGVTSLVSWGCAGGLLPGAAPGTLVVPEIIIAIDGSRYFVDRLWREKVIGKLGGSIPFLSGALVESATVLTTCADKSALFHQSEAAAVDMESASIARVAQEAGLSFLALRAITDDAEAELPWNITHFIDEFGRIRIFTLLSRVVAQPAQIRRLLRMSRSFRAAAATLKKTAVAIVEPFQ